MKTFIASDHAAVEEKSKLVEFLKAKGVDIVDLGPSTNDRTNYPNYATKVVKSIRENDNSRGILLCGSGIGMSMVANRYKGIRAGLVRSVEEAKLTKEHNNANILCLGARISKYEDLEDMILTWMEAKYEGGRHNDRIALFDSLGE